MSRHATISLYSVRRFAGDENDRQQRVFDELARGVDDAAAVHSDLVAFPEHCNQPFSSVRTEFAEPLDGPTLTLMSRKAKEHGIYVVCPLATIEEEGRVYNSSVLLDRQGNIAGVYHKNVLTPGEHEWGIVPGAETPVFSTDFGRVGLAICFDLGYWEVGSGLCANNAELVIWSTMWTGGRMIAKWAMEFGFYVGAVSTQSATMVDLAGREIAHQSDMVHNLSHGTAAPMLTTTIDLDRRLFHPDFNMNRLEALYTRYGRTGVHVDLILHECLMIIGSQTPGVTTDQMIKEIGLEPMRDYLARSRALRREALERIGRTPAIPL